MALRRSRTRAAYNFYVSGDDLAVSDGQRLRFRVAWDYPTYSVGNNVEYGSDANNEHQVCEFFYNGTSGAASGDSYVRLRRACPNSRPPRPFCSRASSTTGTQVCCERVRRHP